MRDWFHRHRLLGIVLGTVVGLFVFFTAVGVIVDSPDDQPTADPTPAATVTQTVTVTVTTTPTPEPAASPSAEPTPSPGRTQPAPAAATSPPAKPKRRTYVVTRVVDGDTVDLGNGQTVRLAGIDAPERGECGYAKATRNLEKLVLGKKVRLGESDEDTDRYGRLLRYIDVRGRDAGLAQIKAGLAIARYDSRDGYGFHPREKRYIKADAQTPQQHCTRTKPTPKTQPKPKPHPKPRPRPKPVSSCASGYSPCIPPYPPDLDCADVGGPIAVTGSDPHGLDRDGDGIACE